jgi:hypothetical protein
MAKRKKAPPPVDGEASEQNPAESHLQPGRSLDDNTKAKRRRAPEPEILFTYANDQEASARAIEAFLRSRGRLESLPVEVDADVDRT